MKKISVITISFNNRAGLQKTIDSVIAQDFNHKELIIIDGGSADGSVELVKGYGEKVDKFVSEKDKGIYNAQNKGITHATGEYLLFLNAGDFLCNAKVLSQVAVHLKQQDIVYGNMRINWGGNTISHGEMPDVITAEHMYLDTLWHPVSFIRKTLFEKYGTYDESLKLVADYDFFFKVLIRHKVKTLHIPLEICEFSADGASSRASNKKLEKNERRLVQERYLDPSELQKLSNLRTPAWKQFLRRIAAKFK